MANELIDGLDEPLDVIATLEARQLQVRRVEIDGDLSLIIGNEELAFEISAGFGVHSAAEAMRALSRVADELADELAARAATQDEMLAHGRASGG